MVAAAVLLCIQPRRSLASTSSQCLCVSVLCLFTALSVHSEYTVAAVQQGIHHHVTFVHRILSLSLSISVQNIVALSRE